MEKIANRDRVVNHRDAVFARNQRAMAWPHNNNRQHLATPTSPCNRSQQQGRGAQGWRRVGGADLCDGHLVSVGDGDLDLLQAQHSHHLRSVPVHLPQHTTPRQLRHGCRAQGVWGTWTTGAPESEERISMSISAASDPCVTAPRQTPHQSTTPDEPQQHSLVGGGSAYRGCWALWRRWP